MFAGRIYIPKKIITREVSSLQKPDGSDGSLSQHEGLTSLGMTTRQVEVLGLILQGKSNKAIARMLNMAEPTVKNHVTAIFKALGVSNRIEAVIKANNLGRIYPCEPNGRAAGADRFRPPPLSA